MKQNFHLHNALIQTIFEFNKRLQAERCFYIPFTWSTLLQSSFYNQYKRVLLSAIREGCTKEDLASNTPIDEMVDTTQSEIKKMGQFSNGPYGRVSGTAKVYKQKKQPVSTRLGGPLAWL